MERIRNIQQNLWQTKLFIVHEKDNLLKLQDDLRNPINKINKLSWVINHKWRQLRTKKANPKELSEVDKYSQSLDSAKFFNAKDKIGHEADRYSAFLKFLREKPNLVAVIFLTEGTKRRQPDELSELIHSLCAALFGFAIFPNDEKLIIRVLGEVAKIQIAEYQGPVAAFFSRQTALSLSFRLYIEWSISTRVYISELMSDIVMNIIAEQEFLFVDEKRYQDRHPHASPMKVKSKVEHYRQRIGKHVLSMITQIRRHLPSFPPYLRWLGLCIQQNFKTYRGASQDEINVFLGELFFTRMLFYPFLQPQIYLTNKVEVVDMNKHNLLQVTYSFREAFLSELGIPSSASRAKYASVLPFLGDHATQLVLLLEEIVDVPFSSTVLPSVDIPLQRSCVMITQRDLCYVINLLMEVLASGKFQPEEKELLATALSLLPSEPCSYLSRQKHGNTPPADMMPRKSIAGLDNDLLEEEVLVFHLPDVTVDPIKTQRQVLGQHIEKEVLFDERKMSVISIRDDPLTAHVQNDMKGRLLHDFDLLYHNPHMEPGDSLSSATSYDSLDQRNSYHGESDAHSIDTSQQELTPLPAPIVEHNPTTVPTTQQFDCSLHPNQDSSIACSVPSVVRVNMNNKTGGYFFSEPGDPSDSISSLSRASSAGCISSLSRASSAGSRHEQDTTNIFPELEMPLDVLTSEFVYQAQALLPEPTEDNVESNAVSKLKAAFSLSPHFHKSYYPKIGVGPPTTIDLISLSPNSDTHAFAVDDEVTSTHKMLLEYLHSECSDATIHNSKNAVQLEQAIIAVKHLPPKRVQSVLSKLEEYNSEQSSYIQYLVERKCELLRTKEFVSRVHAAVELKHQFFYTTLATLVIQNFLKSFECDFKMYKERFSSQLMADEKSEVYHEFVEFVCCKMDEDAAIQTLAINHNMCDERECVTDECTAMENHRKEVMRFAEVNFFNSLFSSAFLPNGEAQRQKDVVFQESLCQLQPQATLNHPDILIPCKYHNEAPWLPAQKHLALLPAYRSPSGKLSCILNSVFTIFKLLFVGAAGDTILDGKTDESSVPGADDLLPVLIYVIIHANPPNLLSTIDYIDNFTPKSITGQDQYMLMQFTGAVEFIKTMLHNNYQNKNV